MRTEDKKIIAQFMGYELIDNYVDVYPPESLKPLPMLEFYFSNWNEVIPVVEKIAVSGYEVEILIGDFCPLLAIFKDDVELFKVSNIESPFEAYLMLLEKFADYLKS